MRISLHVSSELSSSTKISRRLSVSLLARSSRHMIVSATERDNESSSMEKVSEYRLEAMEVGMRPKRANKPKPIAIRGMESKDDSSGGMYAEWRDTSWTPVGWESMDDKTKLKEVMYGRRGVLWWLNQIAYNAAITMGILWVVFRIVLPALGVYKLE